MRLLPALWRKKIRLSFLYFHWLFPQLALETSSGNHSISLIGKELTLRACMGDGSSIWWAPDWSHFFLITGSWKEEFRGKKGMLQKEIVSLGLRFEFATAYVASAARFCLPLNWIYQKTLKNKMDDVSPAPWHGHYYTHSHSHSHRC